MLKITAALVVALFVGYALHAFAQPRVDFRQGVVPMGSASSNGIGFAWFYDPGDRTVHVCRTGPTASDSVDCRSKTTLP